MSCGKGRESFHSSMTGYSFCWLRILNFVRRFGYDHFSFLDSIIIVFFAVCTFSWLPDSNSIEVTKPNCQRRHSCWRIFLSFRCWMLIITRSIWNSVRSVGLCSVCREQPCKTDLDVFRAVEKTEISQADYPLVCRWRKSILSYAEDERNRSELLQFAVGQQ